MLICERGNGLEPGTLEATDVFGTLARLASE
jgi:hypothetical protein